MKIVTKNVIVKLNYHVIAFKQAFFVKNDHSAGMSAEEGLLDLELILWIWRSSLTQVNDGYTPIFTIELTYLDT